MRRHLIARHHVAGRFDIARMSDAPHLWHVIQPAKPPRTYRRAWPVPLTTARQAIDIARELASYERPPPYDPDPETADPPA